MDTTRVAMLVLVMFSNIRTICFRFKIIRYFSLYNYACIREKKANFNCKKYSLIITNLLSFEF